MADLWKSQLSRFLALSFATYAAVAILTDAPILILVMNGLVMSAAIGVCIAFFPAISRAVQAPIPTQGHLLGAGIFFVSVSVTMMRVSSFVARDLGYPEIYNTDWQTGTLLFALVGAFLHLWALRAPAGDGVVPKRHWVQTGVVVAVGCFIAFVAWLIHAHVGDAPPVGLQ